MQLSYTNEQVVQAYLLGLLSSLIFLYAYLATCSS